MRLNENSRIDQSLERPYRTTANGFMPTNSINKLQKGNRENNLCAQYGNSRLFNKNRS